LQDFKLGGEDVEVLVDAGGVVQESGAVISCGVYSGRCAQSKLSGE
jgi:hypothetical protein